MAERQITHQSRSLLSGLVHYREVHDSKWQLWELLGQRERRSSSACGSWGGQDVQKTGEAYDRWEPEGRTRFREPGGRRKSSMCLRGMNVTEQRVVFNRPK